MDIARINRIIEEVILKLNLDLSGYSVLTEVGSGYFLLTSLIALKGGASKVFAWTKDSHFGKGQDLINELFALGVKMNVDNNKLIYAINERPVEHIKEADLITNLGHIRPLNNEFISHMKGTSVVPYMCESWEYRNGDLDLEFCKKKGIQVAGTWENHPDLKIFDAVGPLAVKLLFEAGFEVYGNNIVIVSQDKFGFTIKKYLENIGVKKVQVIDHIKSFKEDFGHVDVVLLADYTSKNELIPMGLVVEKFPKGLPKIVHICGELEASGQLDIYPLKNGSSFKMTETLAYLGPKYVIELHAAGLKVGEFLLKKKPSDLIQIIV